VRTIKPAGGDLGAVEHVVFLMQENRSFDHYFGSYRGVRGFNDRSAGAQAAFHQSWPQGADGASVLFSATAQLCSGNDAIPVHGWDPQHASWNNGNDNDSFVEIHAQEQNDGPEQAPLVMGYFTRQQLGYYYALADNFTICDNYFCSVLGPTMPNRLYFMSAFLDPKGTHGGPVLETPGTTAEAAEAIGSVHWDTMPEVLSDHGISWKVYQPPGTSVGPGINLALYDGFNVLLYFKQYVSHSGTDIYRRAFLPTWPNEFLADIRSGQLPAVSWILPPIAYSVRTGEPSRLTTLPSSPRSRNVPSNRYASTKSWTPFAP
jgi:phospholipase C